MSTFSGEDHIFYDDETSIGFTETGIFTDDSKSPNFKNYKCESTHYDDDKMKKAVDTVLKYPLIMDVTRGVNRYGANLGSKYSPTSYHPIANNCQDFVSDVLNEYNKKKEGK